MACESKSTVQHRLRPVAVNWYLLTVRRRSTINGWTAKYRWHRIYQSQERSFAGYKGLMLAENRGTHRQTLPILKYRLSSSLHVFALRIALFTSLITIASNPLIGLFLILYYFPSCNLFISRFKCITVDAMKIQSIITLYVFLIRMKINPRFCPIFQLKVSCFWH